MGDLGTIEAGSLEQSNVDLLTQMTNMLIGQRSFEANARMITASDRVLDTLINLTR
jgi:flagellar hook protein FlgE